MNRRPVGDLPAPYRHASRDLRHRAPAVSGTAPAPASATTPTALR
ncbi:hypothetical protein [Streptomyces olivaceus]|nr:hypothetical protein [Streptomyces olivaceus]